MKPIMTNRPIRETIQASKPDTAAKQAELEAKYSLALEMQKEKDERQRQLLAKATVVYSEIIETTDSADLQSVINSLVIKKLNLVENSRENSIDTVAVLEIIIDQLQRDIASKHGECEVKAASYERKIQRIR